MKIREDRQIVIEISPTQVIGQSGVAVELFRDKGILPSEGPGFDPTHGPFLLLYKSRSRKIQFFVFRSLTGKP